MPNYRYDLQQNTQEWLEARLGKFSGSDFHIYLGKSKTKEDSLWEKVAERLFQDSDKDEYSSYAMERGHALEPEARRLYSMVAEGDVTEVGLVEDTDEFKGFAVCSPDGLVNDDGIIEIKCPLAKNFLHWTKIVDGIRILDYIKPEYYTQIQFNMLITQRNYCDFIYYHPRGGIVIHRYERDEEKIAEIKNALKECIDFVKEQTGE